eukprot:scaffold12564_cov60-Attheya_sp.AAC.10
MHMGTVPRLPPDRNTPRPRGAHASWRYTDQALPGLQLGTHAPGEDAIHLGYMAQTNVATSIPFLLFLCSSAKLYVLNHPIQIPKKIQTEILTS